LIPIEGQPLLINAYPDGRILAFTLSLTLVTAIVFGLLPALRASRPDPWTTLKDTVGSIAGAGGSLGAAFVDISCQRERTFQSLLSTIPLPDQNEIDPEVVVTIGGVRLMVGAFVVGNRFLEIVDPFLWSFQKPTGARHVGVSSTKDVSGWMIANKFLSLSEVLKTSFVVALLNVGYSNTKVRLCKPAPVTALSKILECALCVITGNWIFTNRSISTRKSRVDVAELDAAAFGVVTKRRFEHCDGFGVIAVVVVSQTELNPEVADRLVVQLGT
jgi:hypothetical protein